MSDGNYLILIEEARNALVKKDDIIQRLTAALEKKSANAEIGQAIQSAGKWFTIAEAAKELNIQVGKRKRLGQNQLYAFLRNSHLVTRKVDRCGEPPWWPYHQPYQPQVDAGRMKLEERPAFERADKIIRTTLISPSGLVYIQKKIAQAVAEGVLVELLN